MASSLGVVKVPPQRIVVNPLGRGFAKKLDAMSPDAPDTKAWLAKAQEAAGDSVIKDAGVVLVFESIMAVFDRRFEEVNCTLGVPVEDGTRAARGFKTYELPAVEVVELKYPAARTWDQILEDIYPQAVSYQEKSRKRDLGTALRVWDKRGIRGAGFVVQLEVVPRA